jgi:hypothetical protein
MRSVIKGKRGISVIVGYVLLITISLALSFLVYVWMKRQAPKPVIECPDTLSLMILNYDCDEDNNIMNLTLKNNGLYNIQGAIIKISNSNVPPIYPIKLINSSPEGKIKNINDFEYQFIGNLAASSNEIVKIFFNYSGYSPLKKISIIPLYSTEKDKIVCSAQEVPQTIVNCD